MAPDLPIPPEVPELVEGAPTLELPLSLAEWYGRRSVYADQLEAHVVTLRADLVELGGHAESLRLERDHGRELAARWEAVARREHRRPGWGVVAGVGLGGLVAGGVGALALAR